MGNQKSKKLALSVGTVATLVGPIAGVISCGGGNNNNDNDKKISQDVPLPIIVLSNNPTIFDKEIKLQGSEATLMLDYGTDLSKLTEGLVKGAFRALVNPLDKSGIQPVLKVFGIKDLDPVTGGTIQIIAIDALEHKQIVKLNIIVENVHLKASEVRRVASALITNKLIDGAIIPYDEKRAYEKALEVVNNAQPGDDMDALASDLNVAATTYNDAIKAANDKLVSILNKVRPAKATSRGLVENKLIPGATEPTAEKHAYELALSNIDTATPETVDALIDALRAATRVYANAIEKANNALESKGLQSRVNAAKASAAAQITNTLLDGAVEPTPEKHAYELAIEKIDTTATI